MNEVVTEDRAEIRFAQFVAEAEKLLEPTKWEIGRIASECKKITGKTDAELGDRIGLSGSQVAQRRNVWERFGTSDLYLGTNLSRTEGRNLYPGTNLTWTHFREALGWEDAESVLKVAMDDELSVKDMVRYRNAIHGEQVTRGDQNESDFRFDDGLPADTKPEKPIAQPKTTKPAGEAAGPKQAPAQPRTSPAVASPEASTTSGWPEILRPIDDILNEIAQRLESIEPEPLVDWHRSEIRRLQTRDIQIPPRLDVPDVHAAIERWCQWVNTGTDKTIPPNSPQLEAVWRMIGGWDVDTSSIVKQIDRCVGSQWSNLRPPEASNDTKKGYLI